MKLRLCFSGKLRSSPELDLFNKYFSRSEKVGKLINFSSIKITEYNALEWTKTLLEKGPSKGGSLGSIKVLLDQNGENISSEAFSQKLGWYRDNGIKEIIFFIGGAEGVPKSIVDSFDETISFGRMVWPHLFVRIMLMEQIYRASTILAKLPYHKD